MFADDFVKKDTRTFVPTSSSRYFLKFFSKYYLYFSGKFPSLKFTNFSRQDNNGKKRIGEIPKKLFFIFPRLEE